MLGLRGEDDGARIGPGAGVEDDVRTIFFLLPSCHGWTLFIMRASSLVPYRAMEYLNPAKKLVKRKNGRDLIGRKRV